MISGSMSKSKMMVFEKKSKTVDFTYPYRVRDECQKQCMINLKEHLLEDMNVCNILIQSCVHMET